MACSCGTNCSSSCVGGCRFYCDEGNCMGGCGGNCSGGCSGKCTATCADNCSGGCKGSCTATCANDCTGGCKGSCSTACNATCTGQTQSTNINKLTLNEQFKASDIQNIITAANFEVQNRRGTSLAHNVSISTDELLDDTKINQIINVIKQTGFTPSNTATAGSIALKTLGQNLIDKIKEANNQQVNL